MPYTKYNFALAAILLVSALVYFNGLNNPFITDDRKIILQNFWQGWTLQDMFDRSLFATVPSRAPYFRPLTLYTFAVNYNFAENNPIGYRLVNVLIHLTVIVLAYFFLSRLTEKWVAIFATLLFALHPVDVQAVSYISSRSDPLYTVLGLLCLVFWHKGNGTYGRKRAFYFGFALSAFFLWLFAKETMVVIPALALVMDLIWNQGGSWWKKIRTNFGWYLGFAILFSVYFLIRFNAGFALTMEGAQQLSPGSRILLAFKLFSLYLGLAFYPAYLSLFRVVPIPQSFLEWQVILGAILLLGMALLAWTLRKSHKAIAFGILWYLISILPVLNLTLLNAPMMEHWLYLPMIGLALAFVSTVRIVAERTGEIRGAAFGLIFLALLLSIRTSTRNLEWRDPLTLFSENAARYPGSYSAWSWLGDSMKFRWMWDEAARAYRRSLAINPNQDETWVALGETLSSAENYDEAEKILSWSVSMHPGNPWFRYTLGIHRLRAGRYQASIEAMKNITDLNFPLTYHALGSAYLRLGNQKQAEEMFQKALAIYPRNRGLHAGFHANLGALYASEGKLQEAKEELHLALRFQPNFEEVLRLLKELEKH